jgi:hypothetical protein
MFEYYTEGTTGRFLGFFILVDARTNSLSPYHLTETRLSIVQTISAMATHTRY